MRKIRKNSNKKFIAIAVILLLAISIGYAALSTTLSINGTANIASSSWLVYFTNVEVATGSVTATTVPTTTGTSTTTLTWAVSMDTPGQFYEYTVDVKNDGSIDAMIGTLSNTSLTTNQAKYLDYTVTYSDGAVIEQYDKLDAGETVKVKVRLEFKTDLNPEDLPSETTAITLTYESNYVQADENAKDRNVNVNESTGPEITYGYANNSGVVEANSLIVGDIINYYYDKNQSPIQCEIIYNDETHGLQVISLNSVKKVILGFGYQGFENGYDEGIKFEDPKAIEAFKNGAPMGYENTDFDKCRWSINHALATLNSYTQEYLGDMSINARCVGCPVDNIILNEDETTNMVQIGNNNIEVKGSDSNISGSYSASNGYTENISEDLKTLDTLGIVATDDEIYYWLCSRNDKYNSYANGAIDMNCVDGDNGAYSQHTMLTVEITDFWGDLSSSNKAYGREYGLRPIFTLKSNIKVEKIGHQDFGAGALIEP